jgi:hypothetical protein
MKVPATALALLALVSSAFANPIAEPQPEALDSTILQRGISPAAARWDCAVCKDWRANCTAGWKPKYCPNGWGDKHCVDWCKS